MRVRGGMSGRWGGAQSEMGKGERVELGEGRTEHMLCHVPHMRLSTEGALLNHLLGMVQSCHSSLVQLVSVGAPPVGWG